MSDFHVDWAHVAAFASGIEVLDGAGGKAADYSRNVEYQVGAGDIMGYLGQMTTGNSQEVAAAFGYLQLIGRESAAELRKVARYYHLTDEAVAAKFDRSY